MAQTKSKTKTYRLTSGKNQGNWQLPTKGLTGIKDVGGVPMEKPIRYVKGANSIFVEDQDKNAKPGKKWFEDGYLEVPDADWCLNEYIKNIPHFGREFVLVDEEKDAKTKLDTITAKNAIQNDILQEEDSNKIKAMAMILISLDAANWSDPKCRTELLALSEDKTNVLIQEMAKQGYEGRLLAASAYNAGIIKNNATHTAVVWSDNEGIIVRVAQGETGIDKLGSFINEGTEASELVMQEIGEKNSRRKEAYSDVKAGIEKPSRTIPGKTEEDIRTEVKNELQADFDKKLEDFKKELLSAVAQAPKVVTEATTENNVNTMNVTFDQEKPATDAYDPASIDSVRTEYLKVLGKVPPPNMNQNLEWMNNKINEALAINANS